MDMECFISGPIQQDTILKDGACMKFYDETKPPYLETDASRKGIGTPLMTLINLSL